MSCLRKGLFGNGASGWLTLVSILLLALAVATAGCEEEKAERGMGRGKASTPKKKTERKSRRSESASRGDLAESEEYLHKETQNYRSPFRNFLREFVEQPGGEEGEGMEHKTPLEQFALKSYHLIGIITGTAVPKAMVVDPSGFGHLVRPGDRIGKEGAKVVRIQTNEVWLQTTEGELGEIRHFPIKLYEQGGPIKYFNIIQHQFEKQKAEEDQVLERLKMMLREKGVVVHELPSAPAPQPKQASQLPMQAPSMGAQTPPGEGQPMEQPPPMEEMPTLFIEPE